MPVAAPVAVTSVAAVAPIAVVAATIPITTMTVASIEAAPVVSVGARAVAVAVMVMARQAEAQVVAAPIPGAGEVAVGPAVVVAEHVVAYRVVDPRHPVAMDWTVHVAVHRPCSVDRPFDGYLVDDRLDFRPGLDHLHRLHHFSRRDFDRRGGINGDVIADHHLAHRCGGGGKHPRARLEDHHEEVEIQRAAKVDHPVGAALVNIGGGNAHLVPGICGTIGNVDSPRRPFVDDQFGAATAPGTGNENDFAKAEVGGRERGPLVEQGVHIEILAPNDRHVVDGNLDADPILFGIGLRHHRGGVYVCFRCRPDDH